MKEGGDALNILLLTRYGRLGASSRLRFYDYEPWLTRAGIRTTRKPDIDDD